MDNPESDCKYESTAKTINKKIRGSFKTYDIEFLQQKEYGHRCEKGDETGDGKNKNYAAGVELHYLGGFRMVLGNRIYIRY